MLFVDDIKEYTENKLNTGAPVLKCKKICAVQARKGSIGEEIVTIMKDGYKETKNVVSKDFDVIITNPGGEQYLISTETFLFRYEKDPCNEGYFIPKPLPQEFLIIDEDIDFIACWGEHMYVRAGGALNITHRNDGYIYGIQPKEFAETYEKCD